MIVMKYTKRGSNVFVSHIDLLRELTRALRRTGYDIAYSKGFNPHININMSAPLSIGIESYAEYVTIALENVPAADFLARYNEVCTTGLEGIFAKNVEKNPNVAGRVNANTFMYKTDAAESFRPLLEEIMQSPRYDLTYLHKGEEVTKDVRGKIFALSAEADCLTMQIAGGNDNLRPDRLLTALCATVGEELNVTNIVRLSQMIYKDGKLTNIDRLL